MRNRVILVASAALVAGAMTATQVASGKTNVVSAKTKKVTILAKANDPSSFTDISSKLSGSFGKGTQAKCCLQIPKTTYTWKFKAGTIKATGVSKITGSKVAGTWKVTKGKSTGRYKGMTGGGTFTGDLPTGKYTFKGTVKY